MKRLSDNEFQATLDKGVCFLCNDKYSSKHSCKVKENRELMLYIAKEEEDWEEGEVKVEAKPIVVELKTLEVKEETKIVLPTILGFTSKGTMKLKGAVCGREVIILIDRGATHNFIHQKVVNELDLPNKGEAKFRVTIGDGIALEGKGTCKQLEVKLLELTIVADFLAIE